MKTLVVTGAGKGLGKAIALQGLKDGFRVLACDKDPALLDQLKTEEASLKTHAVDVSDHSDIENFFSKVEELNPNHLVNNAGVYLGKSVLDYSVEQIDQVINTNIKGSLNFTRLFAKRLITKKEHGVIVNISSTSIHGGSDAVYSLTKSALVGLTKSCAMNFSPYIRVNAVAPGIVLTDLFKDIPEEIVKWYREKELVKSPLEPQSVADTVSFLLSDKSKNYTGSVFNLSNGFIL